MRQTTEITKIGVSVFCAAAVLLGCQTLPLRNEPLERFSGDYGYRFRNIASDENNSDSLFVALTFSGGGTRAAALSYGVLCVLRDTPIRWDGRDRRLLDEVDVISSASGGSLTAAYYALFGDRIFQDYRKDVLEKNLQGSLIRTFLSPGNVVKLMSPFYGRSDLMANTFNKRIFEEKTYGDLLALNRRPYLIVNTTDMTRGTRIGFTQEQFDLFYSDLSRYPVGHAVAASAAYPGYFAPMTLHNYEKKPDFVKPIWVEQLARPGLDAPCFIPDDSSVYLTDAHKYIHVVDGGVADNLGLLPIIYGLDGRYTDEDLIATKISVRKIVIITVNAEGKTKRDWDLKAGLPGLVDTLFAAGTAPITNFSRAQIGYMRLLVRRETERLQVRAQLRERGINVDDIPELRGPDVEYHFIEVCFRDVEDAERRERLATIPTNWHLPDTDLDALHAAACEILANNAEFQALCRELR